MTQEITDDIFVEITLRPSVYRYLLGFLNRMAHEAPTDGDRMWARAFAKDLLEKERKELH